MSNEPSWTTLPSYYDRWLWILKILLAYSKFSFILIAKFMDMELMLTLAGLKMRSSS